MNEAMAPDGPIRKTFRKYKSNGKKKKDESRKEPGRNRIYLMGRCGSRGNRSGGGLVSG
jgi:hypothetical protein